MSRFPAIPKEVSTFYGIFTVERRYFYRSLGKMGKKRVCVFLVAFMLLSGCVDIHYINESDEKNNQSFCGNKVCEKEECKNTCPQDCKITEPWITIAPNKRYFMFEDGRSFFPIGTACAGEHMSIDHMGHVQFTDTVHPYYNIDVVIDPESIEKHFIEMRENGENVLRVHIHSWTFNRNPNYIRYLIESEKTLFLDNARGEFNEKQAKRIDHLIELAEKYGIYIDLEFTMDHLQWNAHFSEGIHPWQKANGGPIENPEDIFLKPEAKQLFKNRIKYIVDRWGSSPNIFTWELFNELDWWGGAFHKEKAAWVEEMGPFLRDYELKKYGKSHIISVSSASYNPPRGEQDYFFNSPGTDVAFTHYYIPESSIPDPYLNALKIKELTQDILENRVKYQRVYMENERLTNGYCSYAKDTELAVTYAEIANGAAGSGLTWVHFGGYLPESRTKYNIYDEYRIDYFQKKDTSMRYNLIKDTHKAINKITSKIDWANFNSRNINDKISVDNTSILPMAIGDSSTVFGFMIKDDKESYYIDMIKESLNYPDGCEGMVGGLLVGLDGFLEYYRKENISVDATHLVNKVTVIILDHYNLNNSEARKHAEEICSNPHYLKQLYKNGLITASFGYDVLSLFSEYLNELENTNHVLDKYYKGYPEISTTLTISGLCEGEHKITWYDTYTGDEIISENVSGSTITVTTPVFRKHLAFIVTSTNISPCQKY